VNYKLKEISSLFKRRYKLLNIGLEFKTMSGGEEKRMYIAFQNIEERDAFYQVMNELVSESCMTAEQSILNLT